MNQPRFCAEGSRAFQENPIGHASVHPYYVLIECPPPWPYQALESPPIPPSVQALPNKLYQTGKPTRFLLIYNQKLTFPQHYRVIILERQLGWSQGYQKREYQVTDLADVAGIVEQDLAGNPQTEYAVSSQVRDLLVCTHGSHDQCCARYGKPFFYEATQLVNHLALNDQVRVWEASHLGGHRFAPTVIDFPSGRYYGKINASALGHVLQQTGHYEVFRHVYRGWGILPRTAQVLEQSLILQWGWNWFDNQVFVPVKVLETCETEQWVTLWYQQPNGIVGGYQARVVHDPKENICIFGSCNDSQQSTFINWKLAEFKDITN